MEGKDNLKQEERMRERKKEECNGMRKENAEKLMEKRRKGTERERRGELKR